MIKRLSCLAALLFAAPALSDGLNDAVKKDYDEYLAGLFRQHLRSRHSPPD